MIIPILIAYRMVKGKLPILVGVEINIPIFPNRAVNMLPITTIRMIYPGKRYRHVSRCFPNIHHARYLKE